MTRPRKTLSALPALVALAVPGVATLEAGVNATVDFSTEIRDWDGLGVNYVELAQSPDFDEWPREDHA
jgi:hypothetical protein